MNELQQLAYISGLVSNARRIFTFPVTYVDLSINNSIWNNTGGISLALSADKASGYGIFKSFDKTFLLSSIARAILYYRELLFNWTYVGSGGRGTNYYLNIYVYLTASYFVRFGVRWAGASTSNVPDQLTVSWYNQDGMLYLYPASNLWLSSDGSKLNYLKLGFSIALSREGYYIAKPYAYINGTEIDTSTCTVTEIAITDFYDLQMKYLQEEETGQKGISFIGGFE